MPTSSASRVAERGRSSTNIRTAARVRAATSALCGVATTPSQETRQRWPSVCASRRGWKAVRVTWLEPPTAASSPISA